MTPFRGATRTAREATVKLSTDRILTTHVGSLPRSAPIVDLLYKKENGEHYDRGELSRPRASGGNGARNSATRQ